MVASMWGNSARIPLFRMPKKHFQRGAAAILLSPRVPLKCAYALDGGIRSDVDGCSGERAYPPAELKEMLVANAELPPAVDARGNLVHEQYGWRYNEVVIDAGAFNRLLPQAVEAFVYPTDGGVGGNQHTVEAAHRAFVQMYAPVTTADVPPLVRLDVSNWDRPFELLEELPPLPPHARRA